jgi:putative tryptophan/tyrosine transport system substrate-binding protein
VINRRAFVGVVAPGLLALPLAAPAQPTGRVRRIGMLGSGTLPAAGTLIETVRQGLRELGWTEGQNITIAYRFADGRFDRLPELAAELVRLQPDLIIAVPTAATVAAAKATRSIPIVMFGVGDPVALGLVASLARPGGNVTGLSSGVGPQIIGKQLQLLKETLPKISRVAVLSNPANAGHASFIANAKTSAESLGLQLQLLQARGADEFDGAFAAMGKGRAEAVLVLGDPMFSDHYPRLADLAARQRLPSMHFLRGAVPAGALMSYGPDLPGQHRRVAVFVDKILKGAKPAELAIEQPTKFTLAVNLKTARELGITLPQVVLLQADEVILP